MWWNTFSHVKYINGAFNVRINPKKYASLNLSADTCYYNWSEIFMMPQFLLFSLSRKYIWIDSVLSLTGSLKGSLWASDRLLDDIMIRKFVEGVMHGFLESEVVIKRRANRIILIFLVSIHEDIRKFYFLVGFTEKLLTELLGCIVKVEAQSSIGKKIW